MNKTMTEDTIEIKLPASIEEVTLKHFIGFTQLLDKAAADGWTDIKTTVELVAEISGVDIDVLWSMEMDSLKEISDHLKVMFDALSHTPSKDRYEGLTLTLEGGEQITLVDTLDGITGGQYYVIEQTLNMGPIWHNLHYILAILSMMDVPNILQHQKELNRRAALILKLPLQDVYDVGFFLSNGKKGSSPLTQLCSMWMKNQKQQTKKATRK